LKKPFFLALTLVVLCLINLSSPIQLNAQKRPSVFDKDPDSDDIRLCSSTSPLNNSEYCDLYQKYTNSEDTNPVLAAKYRNKMIDVLAQQVDTFYDNVINKRKNTNKWFQTILDILEVGSAVAIGITNGERAKSIIAEGLGGVQTGRISVNKNFELLFTQVLIDQMNTNRAEKLTEIINNTKLDIDQYSWKRAKRNLREYLVSGTFNSALTTLAQQTGAKATQAQTKLANILQNPPQNAFNNSIKNFDSYIVPMQQKVIKTNSDLAAVIVSLVPTPANPILLKQKADLTTQQDNLLKNYKNITQEIINLSIFATIDSEIQKKYGAFPLVIGPYSAFLAKFKATPDAVTAGEYDLFLTKVNVVASRDDSLNQAFLTILEKYKI
jgi:hypothetical protein